MAVADESYSRIRIKREREKNSRQYNGKSVPSSNGKKGDVGDLSPLKSVLKRNITNNNNQVFDSQNSYNSSSDNTRQPRQYYNPYYAASNNYGSFREDRTIDFVWLFYCKTQILSTFLEQKKTLFI